MKQSKLKENIGEFFYDLKEGKVFLAMILKSEAKKFSNTSWWWGCRGKKHTHMLLMEMQNGTITVKWNLAKPNKIKANSLLRLSPKTLFQQIQNNICTRLFTGIISNYKRLEITLHPSTWEPGNKGWGYHIVGYYTAVGKKVKISLYYYLSNSE